MTMAGHTEATAIHAVPAILQAHGFRLLVLRQFSEAGTPPAFAFIEQHVLRAPGRSTRHGVFFATAFRPEIMDWLIAQLGRPSLRDAQGVPRRNPHWPEFSWHGEPRLWQDGTSTTEWYVEVIFPDEIMASRFRNQWLERLDGRLE